MRLPKALPPKRYSRSVETTTRLLHVTAPLSCWHVLAVRLQIQIWSGARDLNPGPHGPESHDSSSRHVGFCVFQFDSSSRRARSVQICTNLQPDYYIKYYRTQVVQTGLNARRGLNWTSTI